MWCLLLRVPDSQVAGDREGLDDRLLDCAKLREGELTLIKLAILDLLANEALCELCEALLVHLFEGAGGRLNGISHHDDS